MANIELHLLAAMLDQGVFKPILDGDLVEEHFTTHEGQVLFNFIKSYSHISQGQARFPSLAIVKHRFAESSFELPEPKPSDDVRALLHETLTQSVRRELASAATTLEELSMPGADDPSEGVYGILGKLKKVAEKGQRRRHLSLADSFQDIVADYDTGDILPDGIPWPWPSMQTVTKGLQRKEFYVFAGRPKSRKTFVSLSVCAHLFQKHGCRVLVVSPEMPAKQIMLRYIAFLCKLRYTEFKLSQLDAAEESRFFEHARIYGRMRRETEDDYRFRLHDELGLPDGCMPSFDVVEGANRTVSWVESQVEAFAPDVLLVDSFYRLSPDSGKKSDADWKIVTQISRSLKDLAMTHNVAIIGTHQMNRSSEKQVGSLANMALADAVGQDADLVFRVVTGTIEGKQMSALVNLGGREIPFDGVLINNVPCIDFSEAGVITNRRLVEDLMRVEDETEEPEEQKKRTKRRGQQKTMPQAPASLRARKEFESNDG